jgi:hypothetical protein
MKPAVQLQTPGLKPLQLARVLLSTRGLPSQSVSSLLSDGDHGNMAPIR